MTEYFKCCFWCECCESRVKENKAVFIKLIDKSYVIRCPKCQLEYENLKKKGEKNK